MFNDTLKITVSQMARCMGKGEDYILNNFRVYLSFKLLTQDVEMEVVSTDTHGYLICIMDKRPYKSEQTTPVLIVSDPDMHRRYCPEGRCLLAHANVTVDQINQILKDNKFTFVKASFKGRPDSNEHIGMLPLSRSTFTLDIEPGVFK